jgi:hypothetical protein
MSLLLYCNGFSPLGMYVSSCFLISLLWERRHRAVGSGIAMVVIAVVSISKFERNQSRINDNVRQQDFRSQIVHQNMHAYDTLELIHIASQPTLMNSIEPRRLIAHLYCDQRWNQYNIRSPKPPQFPPAIIHNNNSKNNTSPQLPGDRPEAMASQFASPC